MFVNEMRRGWMGEPRTPGPSTSSGGVGWAAAELLTPSPKLSASRVEDRADTGTQRPGTDA